MAQGFSSVGLSFTRVQWKSIYTSFGYTTYRTGIVHYVQK